MPKIVIAITSTAKAAPPSNHVPASGTVPTTSQTIPSASVGIRRRPDSACAIGSCASTITSVLAKKAMPSSSSLTPAKFFA